MSRFLVGDDLGNIKTLRYSPKLTEESKISVKTVYKYDVSSGACSVQRLASSRGAGHTTLAAAFSNGTCLLSSLKDDDSFEVLSKWDEIRSANGRFIGLSLYESSVFTCTSNGMLRKTNFDLEGDTTMAGISRSECSILPSRLFDWKLSEDAHTFAYGGDEVDLSVWNTEGAFQEPPAPTSTTSSKKRKRNEDLLPGEIWRARNVPNDHLGLRQPIRITALSYLSSSSPSHNLITGTQFGDIRCYDTRAARRPVSNWAGIGKVGGIKCIEKGMSEHELFIGDGGSNLYSIDLRTGSILYGYKGLSGSITSIAPSPTIMASTALDRYARVHSVVPPPAVAGSHMEQKGLLLKKMYLISVPTTIVWDKWEKSTTINEESSEEENEDDEVWDTMENIS
ncbi:hypothetical protein BDN70DRAFT_833309 [Pholiota conissans]|uniref:Ribosome biogenesis protein NSA1 n=1 Tax=Pholiota conissans TaxID=109636 RepID=A0A9P5Z4X6_9AGAR|nr:hypothetical protein BDN70DRAFT_833309 [Pholiota conissans]